MQTIKLNSTGSEVAYLQQLLKQNGYSIDEDGIFGQQTQSAVRAFQQSAGLVADGIVGNLTWKALEKNNIAPNKRKLSEEDFERCAAAIGVDVATIKAVKEVETGGRGGFFANGKAVILFEGHIFWSQLKKADKNPLEYIDGNEDILFPEWNKKHYKGDIREYDRLRRASAIDNRAAMMATSWGLFQIMGFNHAACDCRTIEEFVEKMQESEGRQLDLFISFIRHNKLDKFLKRKEWDEFARRYNGEAYAKNNYARKLEAAYQKHRQG